MQKVVDKGEKKVYNVGRIKKGQGPGKENKMTPKIENVTKAERVEFKSARFALLRAEYFLTRAVDSAIYNGGIINAETMGGSQGETAKVDVRIDGHIERFAIFESSEWRDGKGYVVYTYIHGFAPAGFKGGFLNPLWYENLLDVEMVEIIGEREVTRATA